MAIPFAGGEKISTDPMHEVGAEAEEEAANATSEKSLLRRRSYLAGTPPKSPPALLENQQCRLATPVTATIHRCCWLLTLVEETHITFDYPKVLFFVCFELILGRNVEKGEFLVKKI
nr:hypothetical protein Iba_chr04aCG21930 [Ipomoea batatas]GMC80610.1 hypothetical protein Iba_chr04aCG21940 [Ipomoea batatas]